MIYSLGQLPFDDIAYLMLVTLQHFWPHKTNRKLTLVNTTIPYAFGGSQVRRGARVGENDRFHAHDDDAFHEIRIEEHQCVHPAPSGACSGLQYRVQKDHVVFAVAVVASYSRSVDPIKDVTGGRPDPPQTIGAPHPKRIVHGIPRDVFVFVDKTFRVAIIPVASSSRRLRINDFIGPERAEKHQAAWQRVKSKAMTEEARIIIRRCKVGSWKKENTVEAVKCWNLERIIDAELRGESMPEEEITMNDLVNEDNACIN